MSQYVRCMECLFWEPVLGRLGSCRRHAPYGYTSGTATSNVNSACIWPKTYDVDWCGDSVARTAQQAAPAPAAELPPEG